MRLRHALFIVSALLFVCGLGFVVSAARSSRAQVAVAPASTLVPVATVGHLMRGIIDPAARVVFAAVGTIVTPERVEERVPKTAAEWETVVNSAAALAEAGNLMLVGSRAVDAGDWATYSRNLTDAGAAALKAAETRDAQGVFASGEAIYEACNDCHRKYERTE